MRKKYRVKLSKEERMELRRLLKQGKAAAHKQRHARILLKADEEGPTNALTDRAIAEAAEVSIPTVERVRRVFVEHGFEQALGRKEPDRHWLRRLDGEGEAQLIAIACSDPPEGRSRWTLRLLADRLVELGVIESIGRETVRSTLKKMNLNLG